MTGERVDECGIPLRLLTLDSGEPTLDPGDDWDGPGSLLRHLFYGVVSRFGSRKGGGPHIHTSSPNKM